jgi:membrane protein implicated in regulation of membrane protease activity
MSWADFYLFCFLFGFFFSVATLISGHLHLDMHGHGHGGHFGHGGHGGHASHHGLAGHGGDAGHAHHSGGHSGEQNSRMAMSPFNMGTLAAFLAWFGGTGYLATHFYRLWFLTALGLSLLAGMAGASTVFWFLSKVLMRGREELDPAAYDMVGVLGTVTGSVRPGGTGEMIFSQEGIRRAAPVRSEDGSAIPTGIEVVVTGYRDGIAYVRRWDDLASG